MHQLPGSLRLTSTFPFVGRAGEMELLRAVLPTAAGEGRRVLLLSGEPGSGKSRLVREFAHAAAGDGALVLYGACDAVVHTPYGPFADALAHLARVTDPEELRDDAGPAASELARLLPDLPTRLGQPAPRPDADPDTERHRLHTAVTDVLVAVSRRRPVLLVVEDGHWADAPTLLLLRHLARAAADARLLLLATFRDAEPGTPDRVAEALADLRRSDDVVRMRLAGLSEVEVAEFVRRAAGGEAGHAGFAELARMISDLTEGNPFLVCELWRELVDTEAVEVVGGSVRLARPAAGLGTPESVREVVSQRLWRLAPRTADLLELAATAGPAFDLATLRGAADLPESELLAALDEAVRSGMIEELPGPGLAFGFTHELVRRALYDRLTGVRRAELHLRVGEALADAPEPSLADLAHHFAAAAPIGGAARAVRFSVAAARAASASLAFDDAATSLRTALALGIDDPRERAAALLELGTASHRGGKAVDALEAFRSAAAIARELRDSELLARAAVGYEDACWRPGIADVGAVELLEEAARALPLERSQLRVRVFGGLTRALDFRGEHGRADSVRAEAIAMGRDLGDRAGLANVLVRSYWARGTTSLAEILEMLSEARDLAEQLGDTELRAEAMAWRVPAFVALADIDAARREVVALRETAEQTAQPFVLHVAEHYGSAIALSDGRLDEADERQHRSHEWSRLLTGRDASGVHGIQMFSVRREQGRLAELAPAVRVLAGGGSRQAAWRPGLVALLSELGMEREARRELAAIAAEGLDGYRQSLWLASLTHVADAAAALADEATAALVYPELEPLSGTNVMIGHLVACYGAADRYLGMLATTLGEWERAERHFEAALDLNRRMGASTWLAHTAYEYARMLHAKAAPSRPADQARVAALLREAAELAKRIGMPALAQRIAALGTAPPAAAALPDGLSSREVEILALVAEGRSNREIGAALFISEHTAANHIRNILRKTGCANRTEAAGYAHRQGLVDAAGGR